MKKYTPKFQKKKAFSAFSVTLIVVLVLAVGLSAFVFAKYASQEQRDTVVAAKAFYFESDVLTEKNPTYTLAPGTTSITIQLKNHIDDLRYSEVAIGYDLKLNGASVSTGSLTGNQISDTSITISNLTTGQNVVVAKANSPYSKTLSATFVVPASDNEIAYTVLDAKNSPVLSLTVQTHDYSGPVKITWPAGVSPDNTDPLLRAATGNSQNVNFANNSEYTFTFFKSSPTTEYTKTQFAVTATN